MEIVSGLSVNDCSSIFFHRPTSLIDALISDGDGMYMLTKEERETLQKMVDTAKLRAGISRDNTYVDNIFMEINYRILEEKNKLLFNIKQSLSGVSDETMERILHEICIDKVNEVLTIFFGDIYIFFKTTMTNKIYKSLISFFFRSCRTTRCSWKLSLL
jgi:hypothetical protein